MLRHTRGFARVIMFFAALFFGLELNHLRVTLFKIAAVTGDHRIIQTLVFSVTAVVTWATLESMVQALGRVLENRER